MKKLHKLLSVLVPDNKQCKLKAYTLIELLITVSIIAILVAIGFVVYSRILKDARDSKRQSDLRSIQSAMEQYFADQFFYPQAGVSSGSSLTSSSGNPTPPSPVKTYLNTVPSDPLTSNPAYNYQPQPSGCANDTPTKCTSYCLYARTENTSTTLPPTCVAWPVSTPPYNFALSRP